MENSKAYFINLENENSINELLYSICNIVDDGSWLIVDTTFSYTNEKEYSEFISIIETLSKKEVTIENTNAKGLLLSNKDFCFLNEKQWLRFDWSSLYYFHKSYLSESLSVVNSKELCDFFALSLYGSKTWIMSSILKNIEQKFLLSALNKKMIDLNEYEVVKPHFDLSMS